MREQAYNYSKTARKECVQKPREKKTSASKSTPTLKSMASFNRQLTMAQV
jgi:hypothetical protein